MHEILYSVIKNKMKQCKVKDPSVCFLQYVMGKVFFFFFFFFLTPALTLVLLELSLQVTALDFIP